jgi:hypothetical protein
VGLVVAGRATCKVRVQTTNHFLQLIAGGLPAWFDAVLLRRQCRWGIEQYPNFAGAHIRCGVALLAKHDPHDALLQFEEARRISGGGPYLDGLVGYAQAVSGNSRDARETLKNLLRRSRIQYVPAFSVAMVYIGLGERESALDWLERAYQDHSSYMVYAKTDALLDPVRAEPRFSALLNHMGLSP